MRAIGAHPIATASTEEKLLLARENGAEFTVNYITEDWVARVLEITAAKNGVAAVFDGVGASTFEGDMQVLARKGSLVSFGNASGAVPPFLISRLAAKNLKVLRPQLFGYIGTCRFESGRVCVNTDGSTAGQQRGRSLNPTPPRFWTGLQAAKSMSRSTRCIHWPMSLSPKRTSRAGGRLGN